MNRRAFFEIALIIFVALALSLTLNIGLVQASGTIYIRSDGSVDPPTVPIQRAGDLYTFTADIYDSIIVQKDRITVNGNGYVIQGLGSGNGIDLSNRNNVTIKNVEIRAFGNGIFCFWSTDIIILENVITENSNGIEFWSANIGMNVAGNTFTENIQGIEMIDTYESTVTQNTIANNTKGMLVRTVQLNTISLNNIVNNTMGMDFENAHDSSISGNNVTANSSYGIEMTDSSHLDVLGNRITASDKGIIVAVGSTDNTISGNSIERNNYGVEVTIITSNNVVSGNDISDNTLGLWLSGGSSNRFYHNNFINNIEHVDTDAGLGFNYWDNGYPSGGNYWSGYADVDLFKGPNQDEMGSDGIWDHPYVIAANNVDRYPFTQESGWENPPPPPPPPLPEFPLGSAMSLAAIPLLLYLWLRRKQKTTQ